MKTSNDKKAHAFKGAAALITAALPAVSLLFTACPNNAGTSGGSGGGAGSGTQAPLVTGGASLILSPSKLDITVTAVTADGTAVTVEGCTETSLASGTQTVLHAQGTTVILKGNITELTCDGLSSGSTFTSNKLTALNVQGLSALQTLNCNGNRLTALNVQGLSALQKLQCSGNQLTSLDVHGLTTWEKLYCTFNQLTALNVQGLSALQELYCCNNKLSAQALTQVLTDLPTRLPSDDAQCYLYIERAEEGNHRNFSAPAALQTAFQQAKTVKHWKLYKFDSSFNYVEL